MEIFKDFGVSPILLIAQIVNFLIILFILKKFMYKPVLDMLKKRENEIRRGITNKEESDRLLLETQEKETKILQRAQEKAEKILNDAKSEAIVVKTEIEDSTRKEAERMITQAKETIEQETKTAEERLTGKIGGIAISLLEKSLIGLFGEKEQKIILKKAEAHLQKGLS